ncbi:MAG: 16S rRNA (cytidine(1402)-2'-O)-methyltransferase [Candidatus Doudnabacteria bacterium]|nr:16S rRNA (cytidine(1402)-2'-O)-methyltransferase [Candidatus Doudnabacteria bacterium]
MSDSLSLPVSDPSSLQGRLFVAATPIGNLEDVTLRLLRLLRDVDVVLCEDTRVTRKVFDRYVLPVENATGDYRLQQFHQHSLDQEVDRIVRSIQEGRSCVLVTDAGTPCISDPGWRLVDAVREANLPVEVVAGPSAVTAALSVAGLNCTTYTFLGFPPVKKGRQTFFSALAERKEVVVLYESPHRIRKTVEALAEQVGDRLVVLARELTKLHEEVLRGTPVELLEQLPEKARGEFVVIVDRPHS